MQRNLIALAATIIVAACASGTQLPLSDGAQENEKVLEGEWKGTWNANTGSSGDFILRIDNVAKDGSVSGSRAYETEQYGGGFRPTSGYIEGDTILLDQNKGPDRSIELQLYRSDSGNFMLKGGYSTVGGGTVYRGRISVEKE